MSNTYGAGIFLAEWYVTDLVAEAADDFVKRVEAAASVITAQGARVRLVVTLAVPSDEVLYGVFDAASSEAVVAACLRAGTPHHRLSTDVIARFDSGAA
jgi:hypothetical protein